MCRNVATEVVQCGYKWSKSLKKKAIKKSGLKTESNI